MTVPPINPVITDESDEMDVSLPPEDDIYRRKYQLLLERCEVLQQDNERIVNRIQQVKRLSRRYRKDIKLLMERLDGYGDAYRTAKVEEDVKPDVKVARPFLTPKNEKNPSAKNAVAERNVSNSNVQKKSTAKRKNAKAEKAEKDPNAPKKPCNAFFQFCQEQRPLIVAESSSEAAGGEPSKQEVTKQLASRWRALSTEDKKVYIEMFQRSKEKYAEEMSVYVRKDQ